MTEFTDALNAVSAAKLDSAQIDQFSELADGVYSSGRMSLAIQLYQALLEHDPINAAALNHMTLMHRLTGQWGKADRYLLQLIKLPEVDFALMPLLGARELWFQEDKDRYESAAAEFDDPLAHVACAEIALKERDFAKCKNHLLQTFRQIPDCVPADVMWIRMLYESGEISELIESLGDLRSESLEQPTVWQIRGQLARANGDIPGALRCLVESYELAPHDVSTCDALGQTLHASNELDVADALRAQAQRLREYTEICWAIQESNPAKIGQLARAAVLAKEIDSRHAVAWVTQILASDPTNRMATNLFGKLQNSLSSKSTDASLVRELPALARLKELPLPNLQQAGTESVGSGNPKAIRFDEVASKVGIEFTFEPGASYSESELALSYQMFGGGVGVLDLNNDARPDLYFVQGGDLANADTEDRNSAYLTDDSDQIYLNVLNEQFHNVTVQSRLHDQHYGQGIAVGDFNGDGFDDVYVGNLGENQLYINNGDGTLGQSTETIVPSEFDWTTSCAMIDVNRDGMPDIYEVQYQSNSLIRGRVCISGEAIQPCDGSVIADADDRMLISSGDGTLRDVTQQANLVADAEMGLGVIAADLDVDGDIDLFVANDMRPNFLYMHQGNDRELRFVNEAEPRGIALSKAGDIQACMGVALDDFNHDGLADVFITNYHLDYNTLYQQQAGGIFVDLTNRYQLIKPSHLPLGFGTQSLDADLDGWRDLVVANGDVMNFENIDPSREHRQNPQFFHNSGVGFEEIDSLQLGEYFQRRLLGRSLTRLDWNSDGLEDFVVSNVADPASLVINATQDTGDYLAVRLVGTQSSRDALGAILTLETESSQWVQHLAAGDGYQSANQRIRIFGIPNGQRPKSIHVRWPSGHIDQHDVHESNAVIQVVEGKARYVLMAR